MQPDVQIRGKLAGIGAGWTADKSAPEEGSAEFELCGYGARLPRIRWEANFALLKAIAVMNPITDPNAGTFEFRLWSNTVIEPSGTYYTLTIKDENGDIVQVEAYVLTPGNYDISELTPFDPNQPLPVLPIVENVLQVVPWSEIPEFAGDIYTSWQITLNGDTAATFTDLVDGNLYTIIIIQDANGEHQFDWPDNVFNTTAVNTDPNAMTIQTFVAISEQLFPIGAATYQ